MTFEEYLLKQGKRLRNQEISEARVLLIDESQITFQIEEGENPLWQQAIKTLLSKPAFNGLKIVLFASHGSFVKTHRGFGSLPVKIPPEAVIGLTKTALSASEYSEMAATSTGPTSALLQVLQSKTVAEAILDISGRHIAVAHFLIAGCVAKYQSSIRADLLQGVLEFLNQTDHLSYVQDRVRQLPTIKELQRLAEVTAEPYLDDRNRPIFDDAGRPVTDQPDRFGKLLQILKDVAFGVDRPLSPTSNELRALLGQAGILSFEEGSVNFSSPIHCATFVNSLRSSYYHDFQNTEQASDLQLDQLIQLCVERMRPSFLSTCASSTISEKQYHFEFWRTLVATLPTAFTIIPEFRITDQSVGSIGWVDIRVQWGQSVWLIELLRDGDRVQEHINRFDPNGRYGSVPTKDIAIIDFRRKAVRNWRDGLAYVIFEDSNFCTAKFVARTGDLRTIKLMG